MKISIITLFPEMFQGPFQESIIKRGIDQNLLAIKLIDLRLFGIGNHNMVDDKPYGGGKGMLLKVDVMDQAIMHTKDPSLSSDTQQTILLDPRGTVFTQQIAKHLSSYTHLILICGHYEGFDERIRLLVDQTISLGDFITTGGEIPAMLLADAIGRLVPGVLTDEAVNHESFSIDGNLLEYPQYTMPQTYLDMEVPDVLLSGNHQEIARWRKDQSHTLTKKHRPDLLK